MRIHLALSLACCLAAVGCGQRDAVTPPDPSAAPPPATAPTQQPSGLPRQPAPAGAQLYFISPSDGDVVASPVRVIFGLSGAGVAPAGINHPDTGHHHLLINTDPPPLDMPVPTDERHVHFGNGQTEALIELPPGQHYLQLLLGDHLHIPHDPPIMSDVITIEVR